MGKFLTFLARYVPSSIQVVKSTCSFVIFGTLTTMIFARSIIAIIIGAISILMSLETYHSVNHGERWFLKYYALFSLVNAIISIIVGAFVLGRADIQCRGTSNQDACINTQVLYGILMIFGSSLLSIFASVNSSLAYLGMKVEPISADDKKLDL